MHHSHSSVRFCDLNVYVPGADWEMTGVISEDDNYTF